LTHLVQQTGSTLFRITRGINVPLPVHERVDTLHQPSSVGTIHRQQAITVRTVFPYPEKSRLLLNRLLSDDHIQTLAKFAGSNPEYALAVRILRASEGQVMTVRTASDDLFEAVIPSLNLPAEGNTPAQTVKDVALRFSRQPDGKFVFELKAGPTTLFAQDDLAASKSGGEVKLSPNKGPSVIIRPGGKSGQLELVGDLDIFEIQALQLTRLPDARIGSAEEQKVIQQITQGAKETRRERHQEITLGVGAQSGAKWDPVFAASWRVSFNPTAKTGGVLQVPVRVDIEYAPDKSVLAGVSVGGELALPTKLPVNVRLVGGIATGMIEQTASEGGRSPLLPAFGPTIGLGAGVGGKTFRIEVDYQHLQNLVRSSPNVDTVILSGGIKF